MIRSKWLDWQPGDEIMEETALPQPSKPTKPPSSVGFEGRAQGCFSITHDLSSRRTRILATLNALKEPPGLKEWLEGEREDLIIHGRELFSAFERALDASEAEFGQVLDRFAAHHRECCRQYQLHLQNAANGVLESPQASPRSPAGPEAGPSPPGPKKKSWAEGCHCRYCAGVWHTEEDLMEHQGQCPQKKETQ